MNRNDEQFDEFLRSQFKHKTFEMKDQYWKNAQQMIASQRATAGQSVLNAVFSGIVLVALSAGLLWNSANTPSAARQDQPAFLATNQPLKNTDTQHSNTEMASATEEKQNSITVTKNQEESTTTPDTHSNRSVNAPATRKPMHSSFQRTRKSALAAVSKSDNQLVEEEIKPNTLPEVTYINGKTFRPVKNLGKGITPNTKQPDFIAYSANRAKSFLTIEGGINSYNHTSNLVESFNIHGGLRYYRFLSPKFAISTGLTYSRIQQNLDAQKVQRVDYSFGQTLYETKITTVRLDYIELPLSAYYAVKGNHFVQAGATVGYAIQSSNILESEGNKSERENGYLNGINKLDVNVNVGYACLIQNKYTFSATYHLGLRDITNNSSFNSAKADYNSGIRLTVGYKLF